MFDESLWIGHAEILELVVRDEPCLDVLTQLVHLMERHAEGMICSILLLDEARKHLHHGAGPSLPLGYRQAIDGVAIGPQAGSCGTAAYTGESVFVTDINTDPLWDPYRGLALQYGLRSCWSTPIKSRTNKVLGTFAM